MKVYVIVSMDKTEHVLNDISVYVKREDAVFELGSIAADMEYPIVGYETLEDGTTSPCVLRSDDWEVQLFEREVQ